MKIKADVLVVGAGPAGATAARYLAKNNLKTILCERNREIGRDIRCAEGIDIPTIKDVIGELPQYLISKEIDNILIDYKDKRIKLNAPGHGIILERSLFDKYLAQLAAKAGVEIILGCNIFELERDKKLWIVKGQKDDQIIEFEVKAIIGADGVDSLIGKMAGIDTSLSPRDVYSCAEVKADVEGIEEDGALLIAIDEDLFTGGYGWSFPKEGHIANIGLGIRGDAEGMNAKERLDIWMGKAFPKSKIISELVGIVPVKKMNKLSDEGIILIGDAARLADPLSGGGIGPALTSGRLAAETFSNLFKKNDLKETHFYDNNWWKTDGKDFEIRLFLRNIYMTNDEKLLPVVYEWAEKNLNGKNITEFSANEMLMSLIKSTPQLFKLASSIIPTLMKLLLKRK